MTETKIELLKHNGYQKSIISGHIFKIEFGQDVDNSYYIIKKSLELLSKIKK